MIKLKNGTEVSDDEFYSWSERKQRLRLVGLSDETIAKMKAARAKQGPASAQTKAKMSEALKQRYADGVGPSIKSVALSDEHKAKVSAALKGKRKGPMSEEAKAKLSAANRGKVLSDETKAKMTKARLGVKFGARSEQAKANMRAAWAAKRASK